MSQPVTKNLLLVEDEVIIAMSEKMDLVKYGYDVVVVSSGEEAIQKFNENIDLVLMDIDLGKGMDGTEAAKILLSKRDIPVVFVSSHTEPQIVEKTEKITSYGYVVKNSGITVLDASIKMAFKLFDEKQLVREQQQQLALANEELTSTNEELIATNEELIIKDVFLNRIIDQSPFATWISDEDGVLLRANPALKKFLNLTDEQLVGKYNVLHDPLVEKQGLLPLIKTVYDEGKTVSFTCDWDGNDIPTLDLKGSNSVSIEATMFPIHNSHGELTNVVLNWIDITDRQQAEQELKEKNQMLETISMISPDVIYLYHAREQRYLYINRELESLLGYTNEEIKQQGAELLLNSIHPDDVQIVRKHIEKFSTTRSNDEYILEYRIKGKDGKYLWFHVREKVYSRDESNNPEIIFGICQNITRLKESEKKQSRNELYYRTLVQSIHEDMVVIDRDYIITDVINSEIGFRGKKREEMIGQHCYEVTRGYSEPCHTHGHQCGHDYVFETGRHRNMHNAYKTGSGEIMHLDILVSPVIDENGTVTHIVETARNITELVTAQEALLERERRFREIIMNADAGYFFIDKDGLIQNVNPAWIKMYNYSAASEVVGKHFSVIQQLDTVELANEFVNGIMNGNNKYMKGEFSRKSRDGTVGYHTFSARPVMEQGGVIGIEGFIIDTTNRKLAEKELQKTLKKNKGLLKELQHRAKNSFAMISSMIKLSELSSELPETRKTLEDISSRVQAVSEMYTLLYSSDSVDEVRLDEYLDRVTDSLWRVHDKIELKKELEDVIIPVSVAVPVGIIVTELITNAVKYAFSDDAGTIWLSLKRTNSNVVVTVCDNGKGLPKDFKLENLESMGLNLIKALVNQVHGSFSISNDQGTLCQIEFPADG